MKGLDWVKRMLAEKPESPFNGTPPVMQEPPYPILAGIVPKNGRLAIVFEDNGERGFKQVIIPSDLLERYNKVGEEWLAVQMELAALPTANRKRKRKVKSEDSERVGVDTEVSP